MKVQTRKWSLPMLLLIVAAAGGLLWRGFLGPSSGAQKQRVAFYQDSMHPWVKSDQPGKCTICAMDLTPIYAGQEGFGVSNNLVVLSSNSVTVLHVQTAEVKKGSLRATFRVAGTLEANETLKTVVSAPVACQIQAMMVDHVGVEVEQGQALVSLFSPELVQKVAYFRGVTTSAESAKSLGMSKAKGDAFSRDLTSPQSGVVVERNVFAGQYVPEGEKLFVIVDTSSLWCRFDVYDRQLPWLEAGQRVEIRVPGLPGKVFPARIAFLEPSLNESTRTIKVRAEVKNPAAAGKGGMQRLLRLGMYAEGRVVGEVPDLLLVPRSAVLFPGNTAYAYVEQGSGAYERRRLKLGRQGDEFWEVLDGLDEGDRVVISGNVLIDAQAQFNKGGDGEEMEEMAAAESGDSESQAKDAEGDSMPMGETTSMPPEASPMAMPSTAVEKPQPSMTAKTTNQAAGAASSWEGDAELSRSGSNQVTRAAYSSARMGLKEEMWRGRMALIAEAHARGDTNGGMRSQSPVAAPKAMASAEASPSKAANPAPSAPPNSVPPMAATSAHPSAPAEAMPMAQSAAGESAGKKGVVGFVTVAAGISRALAADDLQQFNQHLSLLPSVVHSLKSAFSSPDRLQDLAQGVAGTVGKAAAAKDLEEARKWFLPFSTSTVELVKELRKKQSEFAKLKVYHCTMAPKPGLWMQEKGPLANPFYGAEMLKCGKEVRD